MNLKTQAIYKRLQTLLAFHGKLIMENKDLKRMTRTAQLIKRLTYILESTRNQVVYES